MSIINLEMTDITLVDQPIQAIMVYVVEEPEQEPEEEPEQKEKEITFEDVCTCLILTPLCIAMVPMGIIGVVGTIGLATPFVVAYAPFYIYYKCKNFKKNILELYNGNKINR